MKKLMLATLTVCAALPTCYAAEVAASEASIRELMKLTETAKMMDRTMSQIDRMIKGGMQQALAGKPASVEQQKIIDDMQAKMIALLRDEMQWEKWEPTFIDIYKQSFTQTELDGMLKFYKTPAGRALIVKMPVVMQHTMEAMPKLMAAFMPKLQQLMRDTETQIKAANNASP